MSGAGALVPGSVRSDGRSAVIEAGVAREWLKAKGKYVPLRIVGPRDGRDEIDLSRDGVRTVHELLNRLTLRIDFLVSNEDQEVARTTTGALLAIRPAIAAAREDAPPWVDVDNDDRLLDELLMGQLADALRLPREPFILKCAQLRAKYKVLEIEQRMKQAEAGQS